jgi:hypothetical protein
LSWDTGRGREQWTGDGALEDAAMNTYLLEYLVRAQLDEVRAKAAHGALIRSLRPVRQPLRVVAGLALIRAGRWLARTAPKRSTVPGRVTA